MPVEPPEDIGISTEHFRLIRRGMHSVVNSRRGTARGSRIKDDDWLMAGKTGTSQVRSKVVRNEDVPWEERDHALFVGFAPYENPRFAVAVVVEHGGGGSKAAAPVARDILLKARELTEPTGTAPAQGAGPGPNDRA